MFGSDGLRPQPQTLWPASQPAQQLLFVLLFVSAAAILLVLPLAQPFVWIAAVLCVALLGRIAFAAALHFPTLLTRCVLFAFILFFAFERFAAHALSSPRSQILAHRLGWIQLLGSSAIAAVFACLAPRLHGVQSSRKATDHDRFLAAMESSLDDFYIFDGVPDASGQIVDFRFSYINPNAERRLHVKRESLLGKILTEERPFMIASGLIYNYREVVRTGVPFTCEVFIDDDMIRATWLNVQVVKLGDGIAITSRDVTERRRLTDHVHRLAHYDQLTGLPNRTLLQDRLQQAIARAQRHSQKVAVFMVDVDHFKRINDSLGHAHGDALLSAVAERLLSAVRETDTVARMGGDEFVVVMPEIHSLEDVRRCGSKLLQSASQPVIIGNRAVNITLSAGVSIYPDFGVEAEDLLKVADAAMYKVKYAGRNGLRIFSETIFEEAPQLVEGTA